MIYDVEWLETARRDLEQILSRVGESERFAIARAVARINDRLAIAPYSQSEGTSPHEIRVLMELPLTVRFRVERSGGLVIVGRVRMVEKRHRQ